MRLLAKGKWMKDEQRWQMVVAMSRSNDAATDPTRLRGERRPGPAAVIRLADRRPR